ncbi:MAG: hypothetical protein KDD58_04470 [Bdellovibrionales bacterium]|nr:hypothetical protein [Bdellovibrionales bacterium]
MKIIDLFMIFVSIFGLISCSSDKETKLTILEKKDDFVLDSPVFISAKDNKVISWNSLKSKDNSSTILSPFDKIEFDLTNVRDFDLSTTCKLDQKSHVLITKLPAQKKLPVFELLPHEILFMQSSNKIICELRIKANANNQIGSTFEFYLPEVILQTEEWQPLLRLRNLDTNEYVKKNEYFHQKQVEKFYIDYPGQSGHNELALLCENSPLLKMDSYDLDNSKFDWVSWHKKSNKRDWLLKKCRLWTYHNGRITSWSSQFTMYNIYNLIKGPFFDKEDKYPFSFRLINKSNHPLYVKFNKTKIKNDFLIFSGFNLIKSNFIKIEDVLNLDSKNLWGYAQGIEEFELTSKDAKLVKDAGNDLFFKLSPNSSSRFMFKVKRNSNCENVYVELNKYESLGQSNFEVYADLSEPSLLNPYDTKGFNEPISFVSEYLQTDNKSPHRIFKTLSSQEKYYFNKNKLNPQRKSNILNNYLGNFNCKSPQLPNEI